MDGIDPFCPQPLNGSIARHPIDNAGVFELSNHGPNRGNKDCKRILPQPLPDGPIYPGTQFEQSTKECEHTKPESEHLARCGRIAGLSVKIPSQTSLGGAYAGSIYAEIEGTEHLLGPSQSYAFPIGI